MKIKKYVVPFLLVCFVLGVLFLFMLPRDVEIIFLDVGQGDAIYMRTPDDYTVLVDGGPTSNVLEELGDVMPIYKRDLDLLILTHADADHINGLTEVVQRYKIHNILITGVQHSSPRYAKLLQEVNVQKTNVIIASAGNDIKVGDFMLLDVIWPEESIAGKKFEQANNTSPYIKVFFGSSTQYSSLLLSGDSEMEIEHEVLMSDADLSADYFKAGHHGSKTSSTLPFLKSVHPQTVIIQAGKENQFGHPHKITLENIKSVGAKIRRNDIEGRIEI